MTTKTRVVPDLNTKAKVKLVSARDKLSVMQIMKTCNVGNTEEREIVKYNTQILNWVENCDRKMEREHKKSAKEEVNKLLLE
jgi:hypothetical protein